MEKYDAAGFLRATAQRLRDGTIDAEAAAQRLDDVATILNERPSPEQLRRLSDDALRQVAIATGAIRAA